MVSFLIYSLFFCSNTFANIPSEMLMDFNKQASQKYLPKIKYIEQPKHIKNLKEQYDISHNIRKYSEHFEFDIKQETIEITIMIKL